MPESTGKNRASGSAAVLLGEDDEAPKLVQGLARRSPAASARWQRAARPAFRSWSEIRDRLAAAGSWAFFLDVDGTLVRLQPRPAGVRMPRAVRNVLKRLATHPNALVTIVTGRRLRDARALVGLDGLRYFGVHGGEPEEGLAVVGTESRAALDAARRSVRRLFDGVRGIWIEDKGISIAVHYRGVRRRTAEAAAQTLAGLAERWGDSLHILNGSRVWEILPREIPGKSAAVEAVLRTARPDCAVVYIGNDGTDEVAFAALPDQITVRVGRDPRTLARFFVRAPSEVHRLLDRMEKELP